MEVNSVKTKYYYHNYVYVKQNDFTSHIKLVLCDSNGLQEKLNTKCTLTLCETNEKIVRMKIEDLDVINGEVVFKLTEPLKPCTHNLEIVLADGTKYPSDGKFDINVVSSHELIEISKLKDMTRDEVIKSLAENLVGDYVANTFSSLSSEEQMNAEVVAARNGADTLLGQILLLNNKSSSIEKSVSEVIVNIKDYGAIGDGIYDDKLVIQKLIVDGYKNIYIPDGNFYINNSILPLEINRKDVKIFGPGKLILKTINDGIIVKETKCIIDVEVVGNGVVDENIESEIKPALIRVDGSDLNEPINFLFSGKIIKPSVVGIQTYKAVGVVCRDAIFYSDKNKDNLTTPFTMHFLFTGSSDLVFDNCLVDGMAQGFSASGLSTSDKFDSFDGIINHTARDFTITNSTFIKQWDHGLYCSDNAERYTVDNITTDTKNEGIKVEGVGFKVINSDVKNGINYRNANNFIISNNNVEVYREGDGVFALLIEGQSFKRDSKNYIITNNKFIAKSRVTGAAVFISGLEYDGYINVNSKIIITGNYFEGFGNKTNGATIILKQKVKKNGEGSFSSNLAKDILIANNTMITSDADNVDNYGILFDGEGFENVQVFNNVIRGFTHTGIRNLGVKNSEMTNNTLEASNKRIASAFGIFERYEATETLHVKSKNNNYSNNTYKNINSEVFISDETSYRREKNTVVNDSTSNATIKSSQSIDKFIKTTNSTPTSVTLENSTNNPWTKGAVVDFVNASTANLTIWPSGLVVPSGSRALAYHNGGGNWTVSKV